MSDEQLRREVRRVLASQAPPTPEPTYEYVAPSVPGDLQKDVPVSRVPGTPVPTAIQGGEAEEVPAGEPRSHAQLLRKPREINMSALAAQGYEMGGYLAAVVAAVLFVLAALFGYKKMRKR